MDIVIEIGKGFGRLFMNPLLYIAIICCLVIGHRRVQKERRSFNRQIHWGMYETVFLLKQGWRMALLFTVISLLLGFVLPPVYLALVAILMMLGLVSFYYHLASAVYGFGFAFVILWITYAYDGSWKLGLWQVDSFAMHQHLLVTVPFLLAIVLIIEGQLVKKYAALNASPRYQKTDRGLKAVTYLAKRIWILPVFFLIPGSIIPDALPFWPRFNIGSETFSLVLFPVVFGFQQRARKELPVTFYPKLGATIQLLGVLVLIEALIAIFLPIVGLAAVAFALVGRMLISILYSISERKGAFAVTPNKKGVVVVAVLPGSPAEAMGIQKGEVIRRVNGTAIHSEDQLYEALQINAAQCRIEVLDTNDEIRIRQHVVFREDHFRIGLIVLK